MTLEFAFVFFSAVITDCRQGLDDVFQSSECSKVFNKDLCSPKK